MKIVISTGGTGGHIYPALALARYLKENKDTEILFTGSNKHMEKDIVRKANFDFYGYNVSSGSKSVFHQVLQYLQLGTSLIKMYFKFLFNRPDLVMGFGAYITAPTLLAAKFLNIPIILHEQNSSMGRTNQMFYKSSVAVIACYQSIIDDYGEDKVYLLGNPRASEVKHLKKDKSILKNFDLDTNKKTILIVMGSLGSESVNDSMFEVLPLFEEKDYQVIFVTGNKHYDVFKNEHTETSKNVVIVPFVDQANVLNNVDLVIARGGATTAAEICALSKPSVIIPSPYVSNNHQYINAVELEKVEAARIIKEEDLSATHLIEVLDELMNDSDLLKKMGKNAYKLAKVNASEDITNLIMEKINND